MEQPENEPAAHPRPHPTDPPRRSTRALKNQPGGSRLRRTLPVCVLVPRRRGLAATSDSGSEGQASSRSRRCSRRQMSTHRRLVDPQLLLQPPGGIEAGITATRPRPGPSASLPPRARLRTSRPAVSPRARGCGPGDVRSPAGAIPTLRFEGPGAPGHDAAVDVDDGAGHPARLVRQEEQHRVRDVLRAADRSNSSLPSARGRLSEAALPRRPRAVDASTPRIGRSGIEAEVRGEPIVVGCDGFRLVPGSVPV